MLITKKNMLTQKENTMDLPVTQEQLNRFMDGEFVQDVFPNLTPGEREFLLNGITPDEWNEIFKDEGEEDEYVEDDPILGEVQVINLK